MNPSCFSKLTGISKPCPELRSRLREYSANLRLVVNLGSHSCSFVGVFESLFSIVDHRNISRPATSPDHLYPLTGSAHIGWVRTVIPPYACSVDPNLFITLTNSTVFLIISVSGFRRCLSPSTYLPLDWVVSVQPPTQYTWDPHRG